jgi:hypothetical protein
MIFVKFAEDLLKPRVFIQPLRFLQRLSCYPRRAHGHEDVFLGYSRFLEIFDTVLPLRVVQRDGPTIFASVDLSAAKSLLIVCICQAEILLIRICRSAAALADIFIVV